MGSKKIIVPQGLINPNETTIIEIPAGVDSEATLIARSSPRTCEDMFQPGITSTPRTRRVTTVPPARPPSACGGGGGGGGGGGRQMRQVTSTTIITNEDESSSLGILDSNYMNSSARSGGRSGQQSTLGVLGSGYMDSTGLCPASRNTTMGILGSGYMESTRMSDNGGNYMDSGRTNNTMGILGSGYMDSTRSTNQSSLGVLGSGYMDSTRSTNQSSLGVLGSGYMDSTRCGGGSPSPKRVKKIVKKVVTETPQSSNNSHSLGILPNSYMNDTNLNLCNRSGGNENKKKVTRVTSETIIDEGDSQDSAGILSSGYFDSTHSSGASRSMGLMPGAYLDSPPHQSAQGSSNTCPSKRGRKCPGSAGSNRSGGGGAGNSTQQNLTMEVQRHLSELEQNERNQINRDLVMFQQARRRLVHDATNISSSGESQMNFSNNNKHM